ncbi:MAG: preprotein translocase subunit SecE [Phycisphaerales bacterium]|nr:preprotein translocase subunit SecE [Phycisphaerales bacterium]
MSMMGVYKSGQGYWTRIMTAIAGGLIVLLGAYWLWDLFRNVSFGGIQPIYIAAAAAIVVVAVFGGLVYYLVGVKPGSVDFLIATEGEMKKVNWSTRQQIIGSTWVVIGLTAFLAIFVFLFDRVFFFLFVWLKVLDASA